MTLSLKPTHLKRYKDIAVLLMKYGRGDLANRLDVEGDLPPRRRVRSPKVRNHR